MSNVKKLFILSLKNIASHRGLYAKIAIAFACLIFLVCLFSSYAIALTQSQQSIMDESASANYYISYEPMEIEGADENILYHFDFTEYNVGYNIGIYAEEVLVTADGGEHKFREDDYADIIIYGGETLFTKNDAAELHTRFGLDSFIIGAMPQRDGEILLSYSFLEWYNLSEDIIGKQIELSLEYGGTVILSATVSGIIKSEYNKLSGHTDEDEQVVPSIFVYGQPQAVEGVYGVEKLYMYSLSSWQTSAEVEAIEKQYNCTFAGYAVIDEIELVQDLQFICINLFIIIGISLGIGLILMIFIMVDRLVRTFCRDGGIYLTCGLSGHELNKLLYLIVFLVSLFAVILAIILTICGFFAIRAAIKEYFSFTVAVTFPTAVALFAAGIAIVFAVAAVFCLFAVKRIRKNTIKQLLTTKI